MYCKICGENCPDNAEFCTKCGQKLEKEVAYEAPVVNPAPVEEKKEGKGMGIASLILSIVSIVCCGGGGICAILGLIFGIISNKKNKNGVATAGIIIGAISLALGILAVIATIVIYLIYGVSLFAMLGMSEAAMSPGYYY